MRRQLLLVALPVVLLAGCTTAPSDDRTASEIVADAARDLPDGPSEPGQPTGSTIGTWPASAASDRVDPTGFRAEQAGVLPSGSHAEVGGIRLPTGHVAGGVLWTSDGTVDDIAELWSKLQAVFPDTGLWPLVIDDELGQWERAEGRLEPAMVGSPDGIDPAAVLAAWWRQMLPDGGDSLYSQSPYGEAFPGLTPAPSGRADGKVLDRLVPDLKGRLGLVAVTRPADVPAVTGWTGMANYDHDDADLSAVLRSWEDRFGAVLVGLGPDTMTIVARRAPRGKVLVGVAAEHFAVAPDNVLQGAETIGGLADLMADEPAGWSFWWD